MEKVELNVQGMSCYSCSAHITKALMDVHGVKSANVNFATSKATVTYDPAVTDINKILTAVSSAGYHSELYNSHEIHEHHHFDEEKSFLNFVTAAVLTLPLIIQMIVQMLGYRGELPIALQAALATIVQFVCGARFYVGSYHSLAARSANMDLLIALGTTAAYAFSMFSYLIGDHTHLYFETSATIITLVLFGRWLESRAKERASEAIGKLLKLAPKSATIEEDGKLITVPIEEIQLGDIVVVKPGDSIPVDGIVTEGSSSVNEAMLTGESLPVKKKTGSKVYAATVNKHGMLKIEATGIGSETALARIISLVETAQNSRAPIQKLADWVSSIFVPAVVGISIFTFLGWWLFLGDFQHALINSVAVLIIACPCALGLATPAVIVVASGVGANLGILFKEASALEKARAIKTLVLDKTGTVTEGKPTLKEIYPLSDYSEKEIILIAASLENYSTHPLAEAITHYAQANHIPIEPVSHFEYIPGKGITAEKRGQKFFIGSIAMAQEKELPIPPELSSLDTEGSTVIVVGNDKEIMGYLLVADQLRRNTPEAIQNLNKMGIHTIMITGDHEKTAALIAEQAQIEEYLSGVLPEKKASYIHELKEKNGIVGMAGDGINDAPALAAADVGFAIGAGSDIAIETADVTLMRNDLIGVVEAIQLSRATFAKIKQNLFFAFVFNIIGIPLAAFGFLNPIIAAAAMALSSVSVVSNALLLKNWRPNVTR